MTTVCDLVAEARVSASRAQAKLLLNRTGAGKVESPEPDVERVMSLLARVEEAVQKAAARAMAHGAAVAAMLTPTGPPLTADRNGHTACRSEAPTAKVPRMGAVVITDVIDGSLDDLRQMVEDSR